jgi:hypothetical protein
MAFSSDFEQMLDEYKIDVSDRTRRIIRRNMEKNMSERTKRYIRRNNAKDLVIPDEKHPEKILFVQFLYSVWSAVYYVLSIIFKITLGIIVAIVWGCLFALNVMIELYCVMLFVHITTVLMKQNLPN